MPKLIGIFGGTFDPIHLGHTRIAEQLLANPSLQLSEVRFMPCYKPVHRELPGADAQQRVKMLQLALKNQHQCVIDQHEITRRGPSFMIDTLRALSDEFSEASLALIIGMDAFVHLTSWKDWRVLSDYCHFIVVARPDNDHNFSHELTEWLSEHQTNHADALMTTQHGLVYFAEIEPIDISATQIRRRVKSGESIEGMVAPDVAKYIKENVLYI